MFENYISLIIQNLNIEPVLQDPNFVTSSSSLSSYCGTQICVKLSSDCQTELRRCRKDQFKTPRGQRALREAADQTLYFALMLTRWLSKKQSGKDRTKKGNLASLERRTADIRDKLARLSLGSGFRRHSAPAQSSESNREAADEALHYGERPKARPRPRPIDPIELSRLPAPILEVILDQLSIQASSR